MQDKRQCRFGEVKINGKSYFLFEEIGRGAASVCYRAVCDNQKYVVKEYFPMTVARRNADGNVVPSEAENAAEILQQKKTEFIRSAKFHQSKLHDIQQNDFLSVVEYDEENGFVVMNDTDGETLASWAKKQAVGDEYVRECIRIIKGIVDETEKYHKAGYLHLDLKAENVYKFNIENNQTLTRIFDFDSIQSIDGLYESIQRKTAHIHTTNECYGKEISDINSQKAGYITKDMLIRLDYYAIVKMLYFLLYGCYEKTVMDDKSPFEENYAHCTVINNYLTNLFYGLLKPIEERDYGAEDIKTYLDKLGFILDNQKRWRIYSRENLKQSFKSSLMSDIRAGDKLYTMTKGISAVEQVDEAYNGNLFLHGYDGGRGKTTAMQWLMFRRTCGLKPVYLYVPLAGLGTDMEIEEQICQRYRLVQIPDNATILFDGYNELENTQIKDKFDTYIEKDLPERKYRVIVSGRNDDKLFKGFAYGVLTGLPESQRKKNDFIGEELSYNPMIVSLYDGVDVNNIPAEAKKHMVGVVNGDTITASTMGEALWNYFYIQIYEKSRGDERAEEEYKKFFFEILTKIYILPPYIIKTACSAPFSEPYDYLTGEEKNIFARCNKLFNIIRITHDEDGLEVAKFTHQNYYDFFEAIETADKIEEIIEDEYYPESLPWISNIAADIIGVSYTFPQITEDHIIVPKGYGECYFGNGKKIVEDERTVIYPHDKNLALELLTEIRKGFSISAESVAGFIRRLPRKHMDFSRLNIGWLMRHDDELYDRLDYVYGDEDENGDWILDYDLFPMTFTDEDTPYENVCFDSSYLKLQDNSTSLFKNCTFKHLKKGSKIPYPLIIKLKKETIQIGNCIYSADKSILIDYAGSKGDDEIILFENTHTICDEFKRSCKNPKARIVNHSDSFMLSGKMLYKILSSNSLSLEFCERDIKKIVTHKNTDYISAYACAYCNDLLFFDDHNSHNVTNRNALYKSNAVETIETHISSEEKSNVILQSVKTIICHGQSELDLYTISKYKKVQDIYISDTNPGGSVSRRGSGEVLEISLGRTKSWDDIKVRDKTGKEHGIRLKYCMYDYNPNTVYEYLPQNLTIYLPFEPDKDEIFGIKIKTYKKQREE